MRRMRLGIFDSDGLVVGFLDRQLQSGVRVGNLEDARSATYLGAFPATCRTPLTNSKV
jgi:hypothetical protein